MSVQIGWCYVNTEGTAAYPPPEKLHIGKDPSPTKRGPLSCPAIRASSQGYFVIKSPFSLHLRFRKRGDVVSIIPVYPFTSINESKLKEILRLEPRDVWRSTDVPLLQIPSPYFFVTDDPIEIEQSPPIFSDTTTLNWRPLSGKFNIHGWHRPLNWAFEWDTKCGDLVVKMSEPIYYVRFYDSENRLISNPELKKIPLTEELRERLNSTAGVTAIQRGTSNLIRKASEDRTNNLL